MTYEELVKQVREAYADADASKVDGHVAFQFNVTGEGAGAFYLEVADGKVNVEPYEYYDRDVLVTTSADVILDIANGRLDPVKAYLTGKLKAEGDLGKASFLKELGGKKPAKKTAAKAAKAPAAGKTPAKRGRKPKAK
ncbi:MAG: SCP2 sterol-binding domain-containing protein [Candidatus Gastranaerophilales bacterium]|nr:SCP2 sterol-binding domain-containing protein [Candidatus Gastranaerophilales bacterium]